MSARFQAPAVIVLLVFLACASGCTHYARVTVQVLDAQSKAPIAGATVRTGWESVLDFFPPRSDKTTTDQSGRASVRAAYHARPVIEVSASGYISGVKDINGQYFAEPESQRRHDDLIVELSKQ